MQTKGSTITPMYELLPYSEYLKNTSERSSVYTGGI